MSMQFISFCLNKYRFIAEVMMEHIRPFLSVDEQFSKKSMDQFGLFLYFCRPELRVINVGVT